MTPEETAVAAARAVTTAKMSGDPDLLTDSFTEILAEGPLHTGMVLYEVLEILEGVALAATQPEDREDREELIAFWSTFLTRTAQGEAQDG